MAETGPIKNGRIYWKLVDSTGNLFLSTTPEVLKNNNYWIKYEDPLNTFEEIKVQYHKREDNYNRYTYGEYGKLNGVFWESDKDNDKIYVAINPKKSRSDIPSDWIEFDYNNISVIADQLLIKKNDNALIGEKTKKLLVGISNYKQEQPPAPSPQSQIHAPKPSPTLVAEVGCPSKSYSLDTIKSQLDCSNKNLTEQQKKKIYRTLVLKLHPDKNKNCEDDAREKFIQFNNYYEDECK